jgi:hypothetical protein
MQRAVDAVTTRVVEQQTPGVGRDPRNVDAFATHHRLEWAGAAQFDPLRKAELAHRKNREASLANFDPQLRAAIETKSLAVKALLDGEMNGVSYSQVENYFLEQAAHGAQTRDRQKYDRYTHALANLESAARLIRAHDAALRGMPNYQRRDMRPVPPARAERVDQLRGALAGAVRAGQAAASPTLISAGGAMPPTAAPPTLASPGVSAPPTLASPGVAPPPADPLLDRLRALAQRMVGLTQRDFPEFARAVRDALAHADAGRYDLAFDKLHRATTRWDPSPKITKEAKALVDELLVRRRALGQ